MQAGYRRLATWFSAHVCVALVLLFASLCLNSALAQDESTPDRQVERDPFLYTPDTWTRLARDGDTEAQFVLGLLHSDGAGVPLSHEKAFYWYHQAAQRGHIDAQYNLAHMYLNGTGVEKNLDRTVYWWRKAAEAGHLRAQYNLGFAYFRGIGVKQDYQQSLVWIRRAAGRNDARAISLLQKLESDTAPSANNLPQDIAGSPEATGGTQPGSDARVAGFRERARPGRAMGPIGDRQNFGSENGDSWLFRQPADYFTVQLISSTHRSGVLGYVVKRKLQDKAQLFKTERDGKDWWYLLVGSYATLEAATAAIRALNIDPASVWIRRIGDLHRKRCPRLATSDANALRDVCR